VPGESPKTSVHDLASIGGVRLESCHLPVGARLEGEAHEPKRHHSSVKRPDRTGTRHRAKQRQENDPCQHGLEPEDRIQVFNPKNRLIRRADRPAAATNFGGN
jgi:hypothetical protein